jgi:hypothetical protein
MFSAKDFKKAIFQINSQNFPDYALALFQYQAENNPVYKSFLQYLNVQVSDIQEVTKIPFLPIEFFKTQQIITGNVKIEKEFASSGTTGQITSRHLVSDLRFYHQVATQIFKQFYGNLTDFHFLGLLPSYLERQNSSLVDMVDYFIESSQSPHSGFYLHNLAELAQKLAFLQRDSSRKTVLFGVTFALLDLAEQFPMDLSNIIIMETGGMKGRRKEMTRSELHQIFKSAFQAPQIHSEYGMTELLSQGYCLEDEVFSTPAWLKIILRDPNDPFDLHPRRTGAINVIDLANVDSCAFIATQDLGEMLGANQFKVLGRVDNSDIRGCNLMVLV